MATLHPVNHTPTFDEASPAEFTADMLRKFKQGAAFGFGDEASGALKALFGGQGAEGDTFGERYANARDYERQALERADKATGWYGTGAEIAGSIPGAIFAGEAVPALRAMQAGGKVAETVPLLTRAGASLPATTETGGASLPAIAGYAAPSASSAPVASRVAMTELENALGAGALTGAVQGAGDADTMGDIPGQMLKGSLVGAAGGAAGYGIGSGVRGLAGLTNTEARVARAPSTASLKSRAQDFYDAFENSGGRYTPAFIDDVRSSILRRLQNEGWSKVITEKPIGVIKELDNLRQMPGMGLGLPTPKQVQNVRTMIQNIRRSDNDAEARFGSILMDEFDRVLTIPASNHFSGGDGVLSGENLQAANRNWRQFSKADELDDAAWRAQNRAGATYSGGNINNAMRQNVRGVWERNGVENYTPDENAALQTAVRGGTIENLMRKLGNFSPLKGPVSALAVGSILHDYPELAAIITGVTHGAKITGDQLTKRNLNEAMRVVRAGGVRNPLMPPPNAIERGADRVRRALPGAAGAAAVRGLL